MRDTTKIVLGVAGAAVVGVAIGMLMAPVKGSDLRKSIRKKTNSLADSVNGMLNKEKERWADGADEDMFSETGRI